MPKKFWFSVLLLLFSLFYISGNVGNFSSNPFNRDFELSSPYKFIVTADNSKYVIDNGKHRALKLNSKWEIVYSIQPDTERGMGPACMQNFAADESGNLYIHFYVQDTKGLFTVEEYIAKYDSSGGNKKILYRHKYDKPDSRLVVNWTIPQIKYNKGILSWVRLDGKRVLYSELKVDGPEINPAESVLFETPDALSVIASIDVIDKKNYAYITKQGNLFKVTGGVRSLVYNGDSSGTFAEGKKTGELSVPGWVQLSDSGILYMLDVMQLRIFSFNDKGERDVVLSVKDISAFTGSEAEMFYQFFLSAKSICLINGSYIIESDRNGKIISAETGAALSLKAVLSNIFLVMLAVAMAFSLIIIIHDFYVYGLKRSMPRNFTNITGIIIIMIITMVIAVNVLMPNFDKRYIAETESKIVGLTQGLCQTINGDVINTLVNRQSDYYNEQYKKFRKQMVDVFGGYNKTEKSEFYFVIYKNYNGELATLMTQNDSYTPFQTWDWLKSEEDNLYLKSLKTGEIYTEKYQDSTGDWIYAIGPIRDSTGKITAVIEIGKNFYAFNMENRAVRKNVIIEVITAIILVLMIFIEISLLSNVLWSKKRHLANSKSPYDRVDFSRFLGFLYEFTFSLPLGFIPVYAIKLLDGKSIFGMNAELASAFPITLSTSGIVLGTVIAGFIMPKLRWRKLFVIGLTMAAAGLFLTGLTTTFIMFTLMMFLTGIGRGLLQMAARGFINTEDNPEKRGFAFSNLIAGVVVGINVGVVVGGQIADHVSYRAVFFTAALVIPLVILFILFVIERTGSDRVLKTAVTADRAQSTGKMSLLSFLSKPMVWGFFLLICVPNAVAYMFLQYTFLIVAEGAGFSTTDVGRAFILNGMAMFYLGPMLYSISVKKIGLKWTMITSIFMWSFSLLIFAVTGNITGAIITIFIMGISEGYGNGAVYIFYTDKIKEVNEYGVEKAIAVNEFMTNVGMAAGPLIFGAAMLLGQRPGMLLISISMVVLAVIYFIMHAFYTGIKNA